MSTNLIICLLDGGHACDGGLLYWGFTLELLSQFSYLSFLTGLIKILQLSGNSTWRCTARAIAAESLQSLSSLCSIQGSSINLLPVCHTTVYICKLSLATASNRRAESVLQLLHCDVPDSLFNFTDNIQGQCELIVGSQVAVDEHNGSNSYSKSWDAWGLCISIEACYCTRNIQ